MDEQAVSRWCDAAEEALADARSSVRVAAAVEWYGPAAESFAQTVEGLLADLAALGRRLESARWVAVAEARAGKAVAGTWAR